MEKKNLIVYWKITNKFDKKWKILYNYLVLIILKAGYIPRWFWPHFEPFMVWGRLEL